MRGVDRHNERLFSYVRPDSRIPRDHPLRSIRRITDAALASLSGQFDTLYAMEGRPSIPPERLLRALLVQAFYSVRSERQLMEQLDYNLLFRWFVGLSVDEPVWDPTVFSKNRERLLAGDVAAEFMAAVLMLPEVERLLSQEHFSVDGTLIQAWASMRASVGRMEQTSRRDLDGTASATSIKTSAPTRHMPRPLIPMRGWPRRRPARRQSWLTPGIC